MFWNYGCNFEKHLDYTQDLNQKWNETTICMFTDARKLQMKT